MPAVGRMKTGQLLFAGRGPDRYLKASAPYPCERTWLAATNSSPVTMTPMTAKGSSDAGESCRPCWAACQDVSQRYVRRRSVVASSRESDINRTVTELWMFPLIG